MGYMLGPSCPTRHLGSGGMLHDDSGDFTKSKEVTALVVNSQYACKVISQLFNI